LALAYGISNNIYCVRQMCAATVLDLPDHDVPDYVLWIDSDNPPTVEGFDLLMAAMEACPEIGGVAGWYRYQRPDSPYSGIAAGRGDGDREDQITEEEVLEWKEKSELLGPICYTGFGMFLVRGQCAVKLGPQGFVPYMTTYDDGSPRFLMDDVSYCRRMREVGWPIYLHPAVFLEHEKTLHIPAKRPTLAAAHTADSSLSRKENQHGDHIDRSDQQEELQVVDGNLSGR
jgi:hypothetical protein